ncbi:MAG: hypothetical protein POG24_08585 [Acidocella sp.]|nr:hypothetical protein [Acidocella sp.]
MLAEATTICPGTFAAIAAGIAGAIEATTARSESKRLFGFMLFNLYV